MALDDRWYPGKPAPEAGLYYIIDRYDRPTGCVMWLDAGQTFQLVGLKGRAGPLTYRRAADVLDDRDAA
jgi:hypothetical protein